MGRHEAIRPTVYSRVSRPMNFIAKYSGLKYLAAKLSVRRYWSIGATLSLVLVSAVDPYSGSLMAYADQTDFVNYFDKDSTSVSVSLTRGGYEVLTGAAATKVFVELAAIPSVGTVQAIAYSKMASYGWGRDQYSCLVKLWNRESNWRVNAYNSSSGAYGIPQALPGNKMAVEGADWLTNPETQINWGLGYIQGRYSTPCGALSHSDRLHWY
jgi:hypothetical protein